MDKHPYQDKLPCIPIHHFLLQNVRKARIWKKKEGCYLFCHESRAKRIKLSPPERIEPQTFVFYGLLPYQWSI